ncbi:MAG: hypothetical protein H7138_12110 [Myxococcales bacterium]|nr:hypothetical protein [Myxococcales bacterium]
MKLIDLRRLALITLLAACGSSDDADTSDDQTPPTSGRTAMESWLSAGSYKDWACEPTVHEARSPSPHGFNRICSNSLIAGAATGTAPWPKGSAAVKELYASATSTTPFGYAVYLKTEADSAAGANWYWYERVPLDSEAPHDNNGTVADGNGDSGPAMTICVGCHNAAGADSAHTPSVGGRDQVYTPVR